METSAASADKRRLLQCLLDAVKQCQIRFGGKKELATDSDSRVCVLCNAWEDVLQHGLKHNSRAMSTFKQLTEVTGLTRISSSFTEDIRNMETEPTFWGIIKLVLDAHELKRYAILRHVNTDAGRGRAWLRASLNERSLERVIPVLCSSSQLLGQFYEDWAFLNDVDKSATLPDMAAGLGSILFAINIDRPELNTIKPPTGLDTLFSRSSSKPVTIQSLNADACPVSSPLSASTYGDRRKDRRKKRPVNIVSFDSDDNGAVSRDTASPASSVVSPKVDSCSTGDVSKNSSMFYVFDMDPINSTSSDSKSVRSTLGNHISSSDSKLDHLFCAADAAVSSSTSGERSYVGGESRSFISTGAMNRSDVNTAEDVTLRDDWYIGNSLLEKTLDSESINSGNSAASADSLCRVMSDTVLSRKDHKFLPLDADGLPMSIDAVSLCDTTSESYGSYDSREMPAYGELMHRASMAVARVQQALSNRTLFIDGSDSKTNDKDSSLVTQNTLSSDELKEAIVAMMASKEDVEEQNRRLRNDLEAEKSLVAGLHSEIEMLRNLHQTQLEVYIEKNKNLTRENDLLKCQLKKYVGAVQLLRQQGARPEDFPGIHIESLQPAIPPSAERIDYSQEASEYERKLVQVAEMHGELLEFNDVLKKQLLICESQLKRVTNELVALRGPISSDTQSVDGELISLAWDSDAASFLSTSSPLISIWIPSAFLHGSQLDGYHIYQVYIRIRSEEWNVYRRYAEFYELHSRLKKKHAIVNTFDFPPKKAFGKKDAQIVEVRRKKLQSYLRRVMNHLSLNLSDVFQNPCRQSLAKALPFFSDLPTGGLLKKKSRSSRSLGSQIPSSFPPTAQQYMGL